MLYNTQNITIQKLSDAYTKYADVSILRLDRVHPIISGNKWFKLKYYIAGSIRQSKHTIATFGGAYSNHIVATACVGQENGLQTIGFIRGEAGGQPSHTLQQARSYGMKIVFVDRQQYREKERIVQAYHQPGWLWIPEGGYGQEGVKGTAEILKITDTSMYSHIACAVGTGTMMAGLIRQAMGHQEVIGISVLKGNLDAAMQLKALLSVEEQQKKYTINHDYHFGGYAKHPEALLSFMRQTWQEEKLATDIVYTSKLLYGIKDMLQQQQFPPGSRLLLIHSGGLQGNGSLPANTLPF